MMINHWRIWCELEMNLLITSQKCKLITKRGCCFSNVSLVSDTRKKLMRKKNAFQLAKKTSYVQYNSDIICTCLFANLVIFRQTTSSNAQSWNIIKLFFSHHCTQVNATNYRKYRTSVHPSKIKCSHANTCFRYGSF